MGNRRINGEKRTACPLMFTSPEFPEVKNTTREEINELWRTVWYPKTYSNTTIRPRRNNDDSLFDHQYHAADRALKALQTTDIKTFQVGLEFEIKMGMIGHHGKVHLAKDNKEIWQIWQSFDINENGVMVMAHVCVKPGHTFSSYEKERCSILLAKLLNVVNWYDYSGEKNLANNQIRQELNSVLKHSRTNTHKLQLKRSLRKIGRVVQQQDDKQADRNQTKNIITMIDTGLYMN